jgi:hypothetical protein
VRGIFLVAEKYDVAFCIVVSGISAPMVGLLPWKARPSEDLLVKDLAVADRNGAKCLSCFKLWCRIASKVKWGWNAYANAGELRTPRSHHRGTCWCEFFTVTMSKTSGERRTITQ